MSKNIIVLATGLIIGGLSFLFFEASILRFVGIDHVHELRFGQLLMIIAAHSIGSALSGIVISILHPEKASKLALIAALVFTFTAMMGFLIEEHANWYMICDVLVYTPFALLGSTVSSRSRSHPAVNSDEEQML